MYRMTAIRRIWVQLATYQAQQGSGTFSTIAATISTVIGSERSFQAAPRQMGQNPRHAGRVVRVRACSQSRKRTGENGRKIAFIANTAVAN